MKLIKHFDAAQTGHTQWKLQLQSADIVVMQSQEWLTNEQVDALAAEINGQLVIDVVDEEFEPA